MVDGSDRTYPGAGCYGAVYRGEMKARWGDEHEVDVELGPGVTEGLTIYPIDMVT